MSAFPKSFMSTLGLIFTFLLTVLSFFQNSKAPSDVSLPETPNDFQPVVQFVVASDSHNRNDRVAQMLDVSRELVADSDYTKIDAALIAGDFTDRGKTEEIQSFYDALTAATGEETQPFVCLGNHELKTDDVHTRYKDITGWDVDRHIVINGVHFIAISYDTMTMFGLEKQHWLKDQLKQAAEDAPNMPIIVIQHPHPTATVYGSINWSSPQLNNVLDDYPQVINFSGHSHYPINDPRSIWQGGYTALGCGGLKYYELEMELSAGQFPEEEESAGNFWLVAIDKHGSVSLRAYDLYSGGFYDKASYYIADPTNKASFAYTYKNMSETDSAPVFAADSKVTTSVNENGETIVSFDKANDKFIVHDYKVKLKQGILTKYSDTFLSDYYYVNEPDTYSVNVGVLESGKDYTFTVTAANAYYKLSNELSYSFTA